MLQRLANNVQEYMMSSDNWTTCLQYVVGQRKLGQLYLLQAKAVEVPLKEHFNKLEPPEGIEGTKWEGFKGYALYVAEEIEKERRVGLDLPQKVKEEPPSSPDMLIKVKKSFMMP